MENKGVLIIGGIGLFILFFTLGSSRQTVGTTGGAEVLANNRMAINANTAMAGIGTRYAAEMAGIDSQLKQAAYGYANATNTLITDATTGLIAQTSATIRAMTAGTIAQANATAARDAAVNAGIMDTIKQGMIIAAQHDVTLQGYKNALDLNAQNVNAAVAINADNNSTAYKTALDNNKTTIKVSSIQANRDVQLGWLRYKTAKSIASAQADASIYGTLISETGATTRQFIKSYYG